MKKRTCPRCDRTFKPLPERQGQPFSGFCSEACIREHKVTLGLLHASRLELGFAEML